VADFQSKLIGLGKFIDQAPTCAGDGGYKYLGDQIPDIGTLYIECSLAGSDQHEPDDLTGW